jgi:hypothetical protein
LGPDKQSTTKETHSENGVDLTLIRWMLSLTPAERLDVLQRFVDSVLEGVAVNTFDLDVVHSREPGNIDYHDLLPHASEVEVGQGLRVQVLNLETLITVKEEVAGEKDLAVLLTMRRTLEEQRSLAVTDFQLARLHRGVS